MKRGLTIIIAVTTLLAGCSKDAGVAENPAKQEGFGNIQISVANDAATRGATSHEGETKIELSEMYEDWTDPTWNTYLSVVLSSDDDAHMLDEDNEEYSISYNTIDAFNDAKPKLIASDDCLYSVRLASADNGEGLRKPLFAGEANAIRVNAITAEQPDATQVDIDVTIINSAVKFEFTDNFCNYFESAELTFKSAAGFEQTVTMGKETPYCWINPGSFTLSGTIKRRSPGTGLEGATETINQTYTGVLAGHCYTYKIDISNVGDAVIDIKLDSTIHTGDEHKFELNE